MRISWLISHSSSTTGDVFIAEIPSITIASLDHPFHELSQQHREISLPTTMQAKIQYNVMHPDTLKTAKEEFALMVGRSGYARSVS